MTSALKWKLVAGFLLVFIAGIATGTFVSALRSRPPAGQAFARHHSLGERIAYRMQTRLNLTPAQRSRAGPIFDKAARELEQIRLETARHVHEILTEADRELAPELTPEQRTKLETMEKQRWRNFRQHNSAPAPTAEPTR